MNFAEAIYAQAAELRYEAGELRSLASHLERVGLVGLAEDLYSVASALDVIRANLDRAVSQEIGRQIEQSQESSRTLLEAVFAGMALQNARDE